ncbi:MAG: hypothetical protein N4A37_03285 [Prolixibacteraceae bacterium]|nr:hypothetical protein [Prolixibacteraceae bacterium]
MRLCYSLASSKASFPLWSLPRSMDKSFSMEVRMTLFSAFPIMKKRAAIFYYDLYHSAFWNIL